MRRLLPVALMSRHVSSSARITGRINEKIRTGHPAADLAFLQHALWGLDHYPDYLRRWQDKDVGDLESALEAVLAKVRAQRADARRECETMAAKHPKALDALRAATTVPARFLGLEGKAGIIAAGARADIVLLTENPLVDISAVRTVDTVVLAGAPYGRSDLDALLEGVEDAAGSWTLWPKFTWQILNSPVMRRQFGD